MPEICVIFDLDGTLVDSEAWCNRAFLERYPNPMSRLKARYQALRIMCLMSVKCWLKCRLHRTNPVCCRSNQSGPQWKERI